MRLPGGWRAGVTLLLAGIFAVEACFVLLYPQPGLFGDPEGYHSVGRRLVEASGQLLRGELSAGAAFDSVRGVLYFVGPGAVFGVIEALRPGDLDALRLAFAAVNTLTALVVFLLGRALSGRLLGGFLSLLLFAAHPSFPVELAKLFPDPVTGLLFASATLLFVTAAGRGSAPRMIAAGAFLGAALLVRSQLLEYVLAILGVTLLAGLRAWAFEPSRRRLAGALLLGLAPFAITWAGIVRSVGSDVGEIEALGNFTFQSRYPYGFWQFLDSDGFMGPYRLGAEPYYQALEADAQRAGWDAGSRREQWLFTVRYVAGRWRESSLLLLDNAYRLFDRPPNRYKWDYPYAYALQLPFHRGVMLLALVSLPLLVTRRRSSLAVFFVPASLAVLHALSYPWPRFAQPALPLLLAAAGAGVALMAGAVGRLAPRDWMRTGGLCAAAAVVWGSGELLRDSAPAVAAALRLIGMLIALVVPMLVSTLAAGAGRAARLAAGVVMTLLGLGLAAHTLRGYQWHATQALLGDGIVGVEQQIEIAPEQSRQLRDAPEALLVFDLQPPREGTGALELEVDGRRLPGSGLVPTLPSLREFTLAEGPSRQQFPQWWALPLDAELRRAANDGSVSVRVSVREGSRARLAGDRFAGQQVAYDGPSFGDWPHVAAIKFDYDADSRLRVRRPLASRRTTSYLIRSDGTRLPSAGVHRIRIVTLENSEARLAWRTAPAPRPGPVAFVFGAYSRFSAPDGVRGDAELSVGEGPSLRFPLESHDSYRVAAGETALCHQPIPDRPSRARGAYALVTTVAEAGESLTLTARFRAGLWAEETMLRLDPKARVEALASALAPCIGSRPVVDGAVEALDEARNRYPDATGRVRVDTVY